MTAGIHAIFAGELYGGALAEEKAKEKEEKDEDVASSSHAEKARVRDETVRSRPLTLSQNGMNTPGKALTTVAGTTTTTTLTLRRGSKTPTVPGRRRKTGMTPSGVMQMPKPFTARARGTVKVKGRKVNPRVASQKERARREMEKMEKETYQPISLLKPHRMRAGRLMSGPLMPTVMRGCVMRNGQPQRCLSWTCPKKNNPDHSFTLHRERFHQVSNSRKPPASQQYCTRK